MIRLLVFGVDCMNILFEIADRDLMIIGAVLIAILIIAVIIFKVAIKRGKVMPISDDVRFDSEDENEKEEKPTFTEEQKHAKEELERVYEQMSADLEKQEKPDDIDEFEREQEENAIISYQELMAAAEKLKKEANGYEMHVEDKADMRVKEAMNTYKEHTEKVVEKQDKDKKTYHGFKNSEIISPIYGIQRENIREKSSPKPQSDGIIGRAYEEVNLESEKENNIDFLNSLKEFRKNL